MTPDKINTAIAEWMGIKKPDYPIFGFIPNFYADLNACREAYMNLMDGQKHAYIGYLLAVIHEVDFDYYNTLTWSLGVDMLDATAPQRCEALLKTIGRWEES